MATYDVATFAGQAVLPTVILLLAVGVYTDCRWRVIHNALTLPGMVLGLLLFGLREGGMGLAWGLLGLATGFGLMMIPHALGQMGGGDVKLMAALGALLGAYAILNVFLYTTLIGGLIALAYAARRQEGLGTLRRTGQLAAALVTLRSDTAATDAAASGITMPYGLAIAAGTVLYLAVGKIV